MDYTDRNKITEKARQIAPTSDEEIERLILLLDGMKDSTADSTTAEPAKETAADETAESDSGDTKETDTAKSS